MHSHVVQLNSLYFIRNKKKTISTHLFSEGVMKWFIIKRKSHNKIKVMTNLIKLETYLRVILQIPTIGTAKNGLVKKLHVLALAGKKLKYY